MKAPQLFDASGHPLNLAGRIGKGGEGEVYSVAGNDNIAVKFYTIADVSSRRDKILAMIKADLASKSPLAAFPQSIVKNQAGAFAGFIMAKVSGHEPLHELYSPAARKASFPKADYRFLARAAANLSRAIASVHGGGCIIGDINHSGVLVSQKATITLIDADSFQVVDGATQYLCKVGVPEYTPPELQGQRLDTVLRTANHDDFGLAVAIFQILWMGRHPFSGRYQGGDMPMEKAIKELRFAYSALRAVGMTPPPAVPLLRDFPVPIRNAFEAAFGPNGVTQRPTAAQWVSLVHDLEQSLRPCKDNSLHHYPTEASECPWCRMERTQGIQLFLSPMFQPGDTVAADPGGPVAALWAAIERIVGPTDLNLSPILPNLKLSPSASTRDDQQNTVVKKLVGAGLVVAGILVFAYAPSLAIIGIASIIFGVVQLFTRTKAREKLISDAREIESQWLKALYAWEARCGSGEFAAAKGNLARAKQALAALADKERQQIAAYQRNRPTEQLKLFLEKFRIRQFKIRGIGPAKLAALTSFGIETAADVSEAAVLQVPGIGPTYAANLLTWRQERVKRFVYDPIPNAQDQVAVGRIRAEIQHQASQLRGELARGPDELKRIAQATEQRRRTPDPALLKVHEQRMQIHEDLKALGMGVPSVPPPPRPAPVQPVVSRAPATNPRPTVVTTGNTTTITVPGFSPPACPRCGNGMILRHATRGSNRGKAFWGCRRFPTCTGTRNI